MFHEDIFARNRIRPKTMRCKDLNRWILLLAIGVCVAGFTTSCSRPKPTQATTPAPVAVAPVDIASEFKKSTAAWNAGDLEGFMTIYAENATFAQRDRFVAGKRAIQEFYSPAFAAGAERPTLVLERLDIEELSPEVALVRGIYRNNREGTIVGRGTTTLIMKQITGRWRIVHDHSS